MQTWEYLVTSEDPLAELGRQGWELVAVLSTASGSPQCYLKRPAISFRDRVTAEQKRRYYASRRLTPPVRSEDDQCH